MKIIIPKDCEECSIIKEKEKKGKAFICEHCKVNINKVKEMTNGS